MKFTIVAAIIFTCITLNINAKEFISASITMVHFPEISNLVNGPVHGFTINYAVSNKKGVDWRKRYNFPDYGFSYIYKSYQNREQLGGSHSLTGFLQMPFLP